MAQHTIIENIHRNTEDWFSVKEAVRSKGVDCPDDTPTADVAGKIEEIESGLPVAENYILTGDNNTILSKAEIDLDGEYIASIPEGVTVIGDAAFKDSDVVTKILLPDTVVTMFHAQHAGDFANAAINGCTRLRVLKLSRGLTTVSFGTVVYCLALEIIVFPKEITSIESGAFVNLINLSDIYYTGTQEEWESLTDRSSFEHCTIHYNYTGDGSEL